MVVKERSIAMPLVINSQRSSSQLTAPECLMRLQSLEIEKGNTLTLAVIIAGNPSPQIIWTLDDEVIPETNGRFIFEKDETENRYSLIITHITRSQEGVYRCIAKNSQGSCSTMGFITVKEVEKRRRRNVSRKPKIPTISEWKSQEEEELDPEKDTFVLRNRHCWDWWNIDALSDSDDVFEKQDKFNDKPQVSKAASVEHKNNNTTAKNFDLPTSQPKRKPLSRQVSREDSDSIPSRPARQDFVRAKSAEPEINLSRKKSKSLPDLGMDSDSSAHKYRKLRAFWEQITRKK